MPRRPSPKKALRQTKKRTLANKAIKSRLTTEIRKFQRELERKEVTAADEQLNLVTKLLLKGATKGVIHKNKAARKQAQLQKALNVARKAT